MKKFTLAILAIVCFCCISSQTFAQATPASDRHFSVGPMFTLGMSTFTGDVAEGYKIRPRFGFMVGALSQVDISEAIAFDLGLAYESRARYYYSEADEDLFNSTAELGYLTVLPMFNFRHFLLGFGIRLPMSGTYVTKTGSGKTNTEIPSGDLKTAIDLKIGGNIELFETRGGVFNFIVLAGYDLAPPFKANSVGFDPGQPDASLQLGLNYLFNAVTLK
jgi:hypothetical protein